MLKERKTELPPLQSSDPSEYTIVGNDVKALFPSLTDIEVARITREAIEDSDLRFENVDVDELLVERII